MGNGAPAEQQGKIIPRDASVTCVTCGYSLVSMSVDASCPECNTPVLKTFEDKYGLLPTDSPIKCKKCTASLAGLTLGQLCPTCGTLVQNSLLAHRIKERQSLPLTAVEKTFVVGYHVLALSLVLLKVLPLIGTLGESTKQVLGLFVKTGVPFVLVAAVALELYFLDRRRGLGCSFTFTFVLVVSLLLI